MTHKFPSIEYVLKNNHSILTRCKNREQQIKTLEKILNKNYRSMMPKFYISKIFKIKPYKYEDYIVSGEFPILIIGNRISVKTSCFAPLILSQHKKLLEVMIDDKN